VEKSRIYILHRGVSVVGEPSTRKCETIFIYCERRETLHAGHDVRVHVIVHVAVRCAPYWVHPSQLGPPDLRPQGHMDLSRFRAKLLR
jgi:hypothetical protein